MTQSNFPLKDADGRIVRFLVEDDGWDVSPTVSELSGCEGTVIETVTKDAGVVTIDVAKIELAGEQYLIVENDSNSVTMYVDGREVRVPNEVITLGPP